MYDVADRISKSTRAFRWLSSMGLPRGDVRDTIVLAGSPRSGTTWLGELLATIPGYGLIDEPLHQRWSAARRAGFTEWRPHVDPHEDRPAEHDYVERALTGCVASDRQFSQAGQIGKLKRLIWGQKNVVKFVRANRLLHWMSNQFSVRGIILIVRHPCAVVASQLNYKDDSWRCNNPSKAESLRTAFLGRIPDFVFDRFEHVLASIESTAGQLAAVWCLDTYFPLCERDSFPGLVTTYERLLTQESDEVKRILQYLEAPVPEETLQSFDDASHSASSDLVTEDAQRQLSKWKDRLSPGQIDDVLSVVEGFGLNFYTNALEPDYEQIEHLQRETEEFSV